MATVLLVGASGRLGKALSDKLLEQGYKVRPVVRNEKHKLTKDTIICDLSKSILSPSAFSGVDFVIWAAGLTGSHPYEKLRQANVITINNLLSSCPSSVKKVVIASSISVYGLHEGKIIDESSPTHPKTPYGKSKLEGENAARLFCPKLPIVLLRIGMIYGPGFEQGYFKVFELLSKGKMPFVGNANNRIPLVHISDVVSAFICAMRQKTPPCREYNIVGMQQPTQKELLCAASSKLNAPAPRLHCPPFLLSFFVNTWSLFGKPPFDAENIYQLSSDRAFSIARAKKELGWQPRVSILQGLSQMIKIYKWKVQGK
ncbi:MAG: NAD(P)-dependent oxidoreductase [Candidatus Anstonellaceae archaeon]